MQAFSGEAFAALNDYLRLPMEQQAICIITGAHHLAALLVRVIPVLGYLSYSLQQYKRTMTAFEEFLQENAEIRTPAGYAAAFGQFFKENATLEERDPSWMALTSATVQYVPEIYPGNTPAQLAGYIWELTGYVLKVPFSNEGSLDMCEVRNVFQFARNRRKWS